MALMKALKGYHSGNPSLGLDMKKPLVPMAPLVAILLAHTGFAAADSGEPPLHVSPDGADAGDCHSITAPCRTIDYALARVGKGGTVSVWPGDYKLETIENLAYVVSEAIDVHAPDGATMIGVPPEFATDLQARGFHVIVDSKSTEGQQLGEAQAALKSNAPATQCVGGRAASFPCQALDLLAHVADRANSARGADIWGFVDLNSGREYAIMGYSNGTAVYDVTAPESPREVGFVPGQSTTWRDIKVYQSWEATAGRWHAYAYVTSDNATEGLVVIDLGQLPQRVTSLAYSSDFTQAHNVFLTDIDFGTGLSLTGMTPLLVIAGSNISDGRFRAYSLDDPAAPAFVAMPSTPADQPQGNRLYIHDAAALSITDIRKDTQCVNASGASQCRVLFDFNESSVDIWDITDASRPARLSRTPYANAAYTHSGWPSEDGRYLFVQDELDERDRGLNTTLRVFDIADLAAPLLVGAWTGPTRAIDHNGFARGNRYYMSNYARGLSVLDISNPASPVAAGFFDTYPATDAVGFPGAWGTYPFLPSGSIAISDIDSGFYLVADRTLDVPAGTLSFAGAAFGAEEGGVAEIVVQRSGGSLGAISVDWEIVPGSGTPDDLSATRGTLTWGDGDGSLRRIGIDVIDDGTAENAERLIVRLVSPRGGATLSAPNLASVYVSDPGAASSVDFPTASISASETGFATAVAIVRRTGSATGPASVDFLVMAGSASATDDFSGPMNGTLTWADGDADPQWIEFAIINDGIDEPTEFFDLALSNATGAAIGGNDVLRVEIVGSNQPPTPPPPPARSGGGGGSPAPLGLLLLAGAALRRGISRTGGS